MAPKMERWFGEKNADGTFPVYVHISGKTLATFEGPNALADSNALIAEYERKAAQYGAA